MQDLACLSHKILTHGSPGEGGVHYVQLPRDSLKSAKWNSVPNIRILPKEAAYLMKYSLSKSMNVSLISTLPY